VGVSWNAAESSRVSGLIAEWNQNRVSSPFRFQILRRPKRNPEMLKNLPGRGAQNREQEQNAGKDSEKEKGKINNLG
jgi:hypothetical protein